MASSNSSGVGERSLPTRGCDKCHINACKGLARRLFGDGSSSQPRQRHDSPQRGLLGAGVLLLCSLALAPVLSLGWFAFAASEGSRFDLGYGGAEQVVNTLALVALVGLLTALLGTATGWLTARCAFPGRRWLRIAQLLPLATPSYLLAATWIDLGSRYGVRVHGFTPALIVMVLSTYSYVFLLSTESFSVSGRRQLEACRSLGVGPWGSFRRVALPMALPAIGAGVALGGMEVVNELGAVQLLGVPTLSTGILNRWQQDGDPQGAVALALMALVIVALLVGAERNLRQRSRCWNLGNDGDADPQWRLEGQRRWFSQALCLTPPLITLGLPMIWAALSWDQIRSEDTSELLALGSRSFGLALLAAALTVAGGLLLAIAKRWIPNSAAAPPHLHRWSGLRNPGNGAGPSPDADRGPAYRWLPCCCWCGVTAIVSWRSRRAGSMPPWSGSHRAWMKPPPPSATAGLECCGVCICRCCGVHSWWVDCWCSWTP